MGVQNKRIEIDGQDYEITQLGALAGRKVWLKLVQILAGPLKVLGSSATLNEQTLASALAAGLEHIDEATMEELCEVYGSRCTVRNGERWPQLQGEVFDQHFAGRYVSMSKWLLECTLYNFASFLGDTSLGGLIESFQARMKERQSKSPTISTGTSGES